MDNYYSFRTGTGASATISRYEISMDINLLGQWLLFGNIRPTNYSFDNGMYARLVEILSPESVRLWVEYFYGESSFNLTFLQIL